MVNDVYGGHSSQAAPFGPATVQLRRQLPRMSAKKLREVQMDNRDLAR